MHQKGSFANEEVMEEYLTSLLTDKPLAEPTQQDPLQQQTVSKLLEVTDKSVVEEIPSTSIPEVDDVSSTRANNQGDFQPPEVDVNTETTVADEFQALFFNVAGLTLAVPLTELGGIHQLEKVGPLFGKPSWFKGVMLHRDEKLNVVDTARWVMPEKYNEKLAESLNYQYLIMLDESGWGLACESLVNTATLLPEDVKWRAGDGKRPWLAGIVKEKMCALIDVNKMISLLDRGLDSNDK